MSKEKSLPLPDYNDGRELGDNTTEDGLRWFRKYSELYAYTKELREALEKVACFDGVYRDAEERMSIVKAALNNQPT